MSRRQADTQTDRQSSTSRCSDLFIKTKGNRQSGLDGRNRGRGLITPQDAVASSQSELCCCCWCCGCRCRWLRLWSTRNCGNFNSNALTFPPPLFTARRAKPGKHTAWQKALRSTWGTATTAAAAAGSNSAAAETATAAPSSAPLLALHLTSAAVHPGKELSAPSASANWNRIRFLALR